MLLSAMDAQNRHAVGEALGALDYPVAGVPTGHDLVESYLRRAPGRAWALVHDGAPMGVFAVVPYPEVQGSYQTSTYLIRSARGTGLNPAVKRAAVVAARAHGIPLYSSVHHTNARSLAATRKLFVSIEATQVYEHGAARLAWRFDLSDPWAQLAPGAVPAQFAERFSAAFAQEQRQAA